MARSRAAAKPNIVVIWGDDIGLTNLSCKTPAPPINPGFGQIDGQVWNSGSSYNGLLVELKQTLRKQLQWTAAFTWQKSLDGNSSVIAGGPFQNSISGQFLFHPLRGVTEHVARLTDGIGGAVRQVASPSIDAR